MGRRSLGWFVGVSMLMGGCVGFDPDDGSAETGDGESTGASEGTSAESGASMSGGSMTSTSSASASAGEEEEGGSSVSATASAGEGGEEEEGGVEEGGGSVSITTTNGEGGNEEGPHDTGSAEEEGGEETGPAIPFACDDLVCDGLSEYCYEDIFDGPSEFYCLPFPDRCADTPTCDCLVPIVCPESLQACDDLGPITLECVTG